MTETQHKHVEKAWVDCAVSLPKCNRLVETKIESASGDHNVQSLKRGGRSGRLWFVPDGRMYVYYEPTHWREL